MEKYNYISLFSGAGIGCYGFKKLNFECLATVEILEKRLEIQKFNNIANKKSYICGDISTDKVKKKIFNCIKEFKKKNNKKDIDVLIATPPCQGISVANHKKKDELGRNSLIVESFKLTKGISPKIFIFENVQSFLKTICNDVDGKLIKIKDAIKKNLLNNYHISTRVLNLKFYGSQSSRTRTLVIGCRKDLGLDPNNFFPEKTKVKTIRQLISDLEPLKKMGEVSKKSIFHSFRKYDLKMKPWVENLKEGQSAFENLEKSRIPHQIINGKKVYNVNKNGDKYKRQYWDKEAPCIHTRNDILASQNTIHPKDNRVFSIKELTRFMTIPNDFKWSKKNEKELNLLEKNEQKEFLKKNEFKIRQCIGEAVPTNTIFQIGKKIIKELFKKKINLNSTKFLEQLIKNNNLFVQDNLKKFIQNNFRKYDLNFFSKLIEYANSNREINSAYYTDQSICIDLVNNLPDFKKDEISILEPAVGSGNFIFPLIRKFKNYKKVIIDAFDIDYKLLDYLNFLLEKYKINKNIKINLINKDFLLTNLNKKYDLVIGNPPFGKIKDFSRLNKYIKKNVVQRNLNQFIPFLEKCLELSNKVCFILPKSFISSPIYDEIRHKIEKKNIFSLFDFGENCFKGVKIETIGIVLDGKLKNDNELLFNSYITKKTYLKKQNYIIDSKYPSWLLYRNSFFDNFASRIKFNIFNYYRDRQITKKNTKKVGNIRVIKSRNIDDNKIKKIPGYDAYLNNYKKFAVSKFINKDVFIVPNLSYYPRACKLPKNSIVDGSAAILIPKNGDKIDEKNLSFYSTKEFTEFYKIARNYGTRSLNIDKNSVFFWGLEKKNAVSSFR